MKTQSLILENALKSVDSGDEASVRAAASYILSEGNYVKTGDTVAIIDDPTHSFAGLKGKVKKIHQASGTCEVELANGVCAPVQSNLLFVV